MANLLSRGTTLVLSGGFAAEWTRIVGPGFTREQVPTSHMGTTTAKTFTPATLYDPGELQISGRYDPANPPTLTATTQTVTIDWGGDGDTSTGSGFITSFTPTAEAEDDESLISFEMTIKATGAWTW